MGVDGVLLTRFTKTNAGSMACRDVVQRVWQKYAEERGAAETADSDDEWSVPYGETCYSGSYYPGDCSKCASTTSTLLQLTSS